MITIKFTRSQYNALLEALSMLDDEDFKASPFAGPVKEVIKKKNEANI